MKDSIVRPELRRPRMPIKHNLLLFSNFMLLFTSSFNAQDASPVTIYDARTFADTETIFPASGIGAFSHDGKNILMTSDRNGIFNVYALPVDGGEAELLTDSDKEMITAVSWFPEDNRFLFESDNAGTEHNHLYVRLPEGSSIDLTPGENVRADFHGWNEDRTAFYVQTNERTLRVSDLYRYSTNGYGREMIYRNDDGLYIQGISRNGRWIALRQINSNIDTDVFIYDVVNRKTKIISQDKKDVKHSFLDFSPGLDAAFYSTDGMGEFLQVWRYDLNTGEQSPYEEHPWDIRRISFSPQGTFRITQVNEEGFPTAKVITLDTGKPIVLPQFESGEPINIQFSDDESMALVGVMSSRSPIDYYLVNFRETESRPQRLTQSLSHAINPDDLVEAEVIRFASYDNLEIPGYLYRPKIASADNPVPVLIDLHGGPGGQSTRTWDMRYQHLVNHGYAVFAVNYRGSGGYGKKFLYLDDRRHGEADLGDILSARDWLAELDWIDSGRMGLIGDSFGGYLTLAMLTLHPESFELGIAGHGPVNWISTLKIAKDRLGPRVIEQYDEIGHPEKDAERLQRISPYFHAERVVKPLLIFHGMNDPRYDFKEIEEFVETVRANEIPVEYLLFENEGHYLVGRDNRIKAQEEILDFLQKFLVKPRN